MKVTAQDLTRLRWNLILVGFLIACGAGAVAASLHAEHQAERDFVQAQAQEREARSRLERASEEEAEIRQKIGRYREMLARGHIGQEHRLDWIETIAQIKSRRRLMELDFELSPQHLVEATLLPGGAGAGSHEFFASTMKLRMQLLHEDDLLGFLGDLVGNVQAIVHVRSCHVERLPKTGTEHGVGAQLKADCVIDWITLREKT